MLLHGIWVVIFGSYVPERKREWGMKLKIYLYLYWIMIFFAGCLWVIIAQVF